MKLISHPTALLLAIGACMLISACNQTTPETETAVEEMPVEEAVSEDPMPELDPALDPLMVLAESSTLLADTLNMKMYVSTMEPGDSVGIHQHLDHTIYVLEGGTLLVYMGGSNPVEMQLEEGYGMISGPMTDAAVNIGETPVTLLTTEIYRPR